MPGSTHSTDSDVPPLDFTTFHNIINGQKVEGKTTRTGINPATEQPNPEVPVATPEDVDAAVRAAREAFKTWSKVPVAERQAAVQSFAKALSSNREEFAKLLTTEQGKPLAMARAEVDGGFYWLSELGKLQVPEEICEDTDERQVVTRYTPLGVCVGIVPWNFPILLACGKIAPALVTGNTLIVKPSPFTPYCDLKLVELAQSFLPPGVLQVLSGDDNLGPWLTEHEGVDKISFTGSSATGKLVMKSASKTLKRVTLELGGNDPAIVCKDVDIEATAPKVAALAFMNSGQVCIAIKRIYVHEDIYDKFIAEAAKYTKTQVVGDGAAEGTNLGPIQNSMQYEKVKAFFNDIDKEKWKVAAGGTVDTNTKGYYVNPTIIDNPADNSTIVTEEPFGPIVPFLKWSDEADVIARANNTKMGLGGSVWTKDLKAARRIAEQIDSGTVWVNNHLALSPGAPFGGHKNSGVGHEWGVSGLKSYCNVQTLFLAKK